MQLFCKIYLSGGLSAGALKATTVTKEMAKSKSLYGYAAGLYMKDELKAQQFLEECYEQYRNHPKEFKDCFSAKTMVIFRKYWNKINQDVK